MPALISNYQKKETAVRLKKMYNISQQTIKLSEADNGPLEYWDTTLNGHEFFNKYIKNYIKSIQELSTTELWSIAPRQLLNGSSYTGTTYRGNNSTHVFLADGSMITFNLNSSGDKGLWIGIDINGTQRPNKVGKDTFIFFLSAKYGLQPIGGKGTGSTWSYGEYDRNKITGSNGNACSKGKTGYWCSTLIINDGWEIAKDYPW